MILKPLKKILKCLLSAAISVGKNIVLALVRWLFVNNNQVCNMTLFLKISNMSEVQTELLSENFTSIAGMSLNV